MKSRKLKLGIVGLLGIVGTIALQTQSQDEQPLSETNAVENQPAEPDRSVYHIRGLSNVLPANKGSRAAAAEAWRDLNERLKTMGPLVTSNYSIGAIGISNETAYIKLITNASSLDQKWTVDRKEVRKNKARRKAEMKEKGLMLDEIAWEENMKDKAQALFVGMPHRQVTELLGEPTILRILDVQIGEKTFTNPLIQYSELSNFPDKRFSFWYSARKTDSQLKALSPIERLSIEFDEAGLVERYEWQ